MQTIANELSQMEADLAETQETERSRRREEGKVQAEKLVKGFSEHVPAVIDYVVEHGIPKDVAERDWPLNPQTAVWAYKAMMFDRMQAKAKAKPEAKPAAPVKPLKGKGNSRPGHPDAMSTDQWMKERERQLRGR